MTPIYTPILHLEERAMSGPPFKYTKAIRSFVDKKDAEKFLESDECKSWYKEYNDCGIGDSYLYRSEIIESVM